MTEDDDLRSPARRREALRGVDIHDPRPHHELVRIIFDVERRWRERSGPTEDVGDDDGESFEHVYVAALLLFLVGDPSDAPRLFAAKYRTGDMNLGLGMDAQSIFGAGRQETLEWLIANGYTQEHGELSEWLDKWEDPTIEAWARHQRDYFYTDAGDLRFDPI